MSFEVLKKKYEALKKSWNGGKIDDVGKQLDGLKLALTEIAFLPTDEGEKYRFCADLAKKGQQCMPTTSTSSIFQP